MDKIEKLLTEISNKLDVIMTHCFVKAGRKEVSFFELYSEFKKATDAIITSKEGPPCDIDFLIDYARRTGSFEISNDRKFAVVKKDGMLYNIPYERFTNG